MRGIVERAEMRESHAPEQEQAEQGGEQGRNGRARSRSDGGAGMSGLE
jgi:hypothetical protein